MNFSLAEEQIIYIYIFFYFFLNYILLLQVFFSVRQKNARRKARILG